MKNDSPYQLLAARVLRERMNANTKRLNEHRSRVSEVLRELQRPASRDHSFRGGQSNAAISARVRLAQAVEYCAR